MAILLNREMFVYNENTSETEDHDVFEGYVYLTDKHSAAKCSPDGNWIVLGSLEALLLYIEMRVAKLEGVDDIKGMFGVHSKTVRKAIWNDDENRTICEISWAWTGDDHTPDGKAKWVIANVELSGMTLEEFYNEAKALGYEKED